MIKKMLLLMFCIFFTFMLCPKAQEVQNDSLLNYVELANDDVTKVKTGDLCKNNNLKIPLKYVGWVLTGAKIIIPILIIIFGVIDFFKIITSGKPEELPKAAQSILMRCIAGVIIFFIPAIINFIFTLVDDFNDYSSSYSECTKCLVNPNDC